MDRVKRSEHGVIVNPFYLSPDHIVADANELMAKYKISESDLQERQTVAWLQTGTCGFWQTIPKVKK